jgi:hypothetical protein
MDDVWQMISRDPLFIAYSQLAQQKNLPEPSSLAHTGKILAKFGRYTMVSHCYVDSLLLALSNSPKTSWQLLRFIERNITGIGRNKAGDPKIYMTYKATDVIKKANIKSVDSFYKAKKDLENKRIIFFRRNKKKLYLNIFPLTWNLEDDKAARVREIVNKELEKVGRNGNGETN